MSRESLQAAEAGRPGVLRLGLETLRHQFRARDLGMRSPELRDLTAQERQRLHAVAHAETRHHLFPPRLETEFQRHMRESSRGARIVLACIPLLLFSTSPFWGPAWLGFTPTVAELVQLLAFAIITPLFLAVCLVQARHPARQFTEWLLMAAFIVEVFCLEWIGYSGALGGYRIDPSLSVTIPVAVIALARLPLPHCLGFVAAYLGIVGWNRLMPGPGHGTHTPTTWVLDFVLLGVTLLAAFWTRLASRRQWALNLLLEMIAYKDALTGLPNRRALEEHYGVVTRGLNRSVTRQLFFALIDLDHFKKINDQYGHEYGDGVLSEIGVVLGQFARRPLDFCARVGGEEFALLLYDCSLRDGRTRLLELLEAVRGLDIEHDGNVDRRVTCSAGAAVAWPNTSFSLLFRTADEHLYEAKRRGRNTISAAEQPLGVLLTPVK